MVKLASILFCLLVYNGLIAQEGFLKVYSNKGYDKGEGIVQLTDSSYLVVGTSTSFSEEPPQMFLMKLDKAGNRLWSHHYGNQEIDHGRRVIAREGDGIYLFGHTNDNLAGDFNLCVVKTDEQGELLWTKQFETGGWNFLKDAYLLGDSTFVLAGSTDNTVDGNKDNLLLRIDPAGTLLWKNQFGGLGDDFLTDIEQNSDTSYLISGAQYNEDSSLLKARIWCNYLDGTALWTKEYGPNGNYIINGLTTWNDLIYGVGMRQDTLGVDGDEYTVRANDVGVELHSYAYGSVGKRSMEEIIPFAKQGEFYVSFSRNDEFTFEGGEDLFYLQYDQNLNYIPSLFEIKGFGPDLYGEMIMTLDSMLVTVGSVTEYGKGELSVFVLKIGRDNDYPTIDFTDTSDLVVIHEIADLPEGISYYPNPSNGILNVNHQQNENAVLKIYSTRGKQVYKAALAANSISEMNVNHLDSGVYFLTYSSSEKTYQLGKLVKL
jgi:hypothetical protein